MKKTLFVFILFIGISVTNAQPCKLVTPGMTKNEVLKVVGKPYKIEIVAGEKVSKDTAVVWYYGSEEKEETQRIFFRGDRVDKAVIANGKKYDELLIALEHGEFTESELDEQIEKMNREYCK